MLSQTIQTKLLKTRNHLRLLFTLLGLSRVILAALVVMVVSFFLDWLVEFPVGVRAGLALVGAVVVFYSVIRFLYRPLETTLRPEVVALHIEETHPDLRDSLLTALDFAKDPTGAKSYTSGELIAESLRYAEEKAKAIEPARVKQAGPVAFVAVGTLLLCAMFGGFFVKNPDKWDLFVSRMLFFSSQPWPKNTAISLLPEQDEIIVPRGGSLIVKAAVADRRGVLHEFAEVTSQGLETGKGRTDPMHLEPRSKETRQTNFNWTFANIIEDFTFYVSAGDQRTQAKTVKVKTRPRIEQIRTRLFYPLHLAIENTPEDKPIELQTIRTVMGTRVESKLVANLELTEATALLRSTLGTSRASKAFPYFASGRIPPDAPTGRALLRVRPDGSRELSIFDIVVRPADDATMAALRSASPEDRDAAAVREAPRVFRMARPDFEAVSEICGLDGAARLAWTPSDSKNLGLTFDVRAPTVFYFQLRSVDGFENDKPVEFTIQAQPDREPQVRMVKPGKKVAATPTGKLPIVLAASDDFGLRTVSLVLRLTRQGSTVPLDSLSFPVLEQAKEVENKTTLDFAKFKLEYGDRIEYWAEATDYYEGIDHVGRSHQYQIHIVNEDEMMQSFQGRLNRLLEELKALIEQEKKIQTDVGKARMAQSLEETIRRQLLLVQTDQRRVGDSLIKIAEEFGAILDEMVNNQVGTEVDQKLYSEARDITGKIGGIDIPKVLDDLQTVRKAVGWNDEVSAAFGRMAPRIADIIFELETLVSRLKRWDQVTELSRILSKMKTDETGVRDGLNKHRNP